MYREHIRPEFKRRGCFIQRFEAPGVPDVLVMRDNKSLWIELKVITGLGPVIKPDWRVGQMAWIAGMREKGNENIAVCIWFKGEYFYLPPQEKYEGELVCQKKKFLKFLGKKTSSRTGSI